MTYQLPTNLAALPPNLAPAGWRVMPIEGTGVTVFRSPSGLNVSAVDTVDDAGQAWRRVVVSRLGRWPNRLDLEFVVRHFLNEGASYEVNPVHGLEHLTVHIDHKVGGGQGTAADARERLDRVCLLNEAANARREQSTMRASMARVQLTTPAGWRRRPSPLGPPVYDRDGFQVIVCEEDRGEERWATLSVGRADRKPSLDEAQRVARVFLGEVGRAAAPRSMDDEPRKVLVLECRLG